MRSNNNTNARSIAMVLIYLCFIFLSGYIFYFYSLKSELVCWGNKSRDGLYFLALFFLLLPLMVLLSILKILLWKINNYIRFSFLLYALLVTLPAIISIKSQVSLGVGMLVCIIVCILIIIEYIVVIHNRIFSR
jgi:hypothetical protein